MFFKRKNQTEEQADVKLGVERALKHAAAKDPLAQQEKIRRMESAIAALEAAAQGVDAVSSMLREAKDLAGSAAETTSIAKRALIAERYNDVIEGIDDAVRSADADGLNLINEGDDEIEIALEETGAKLIVRHTRLTRGEGGLRVNPAREAFDHDDEIAVIRDEIKRALGRIDGLAMRYCSDAAFLTERMAGRAA